MKDQTVATEMTTGFMDLFSEDQVYPRHLQFQLQCSTPAHHQLHLGCEKGIAGHYDETRGLEHLSLHVSRHILHLAVVDPGGAPFTAKRTIFSLLIQTGCLSSLDNERLPDWFLYRFIGLTLERIQVGRYFRSSFEAGG